MLTIIGKRIEISLISLTTHKPIKDVNWIKVNKFTLDNGTLRKYVKSGWYFFGISNKHSRSNICNPFNEATPMNRKSPKSTGIGIIDNIGAMKTDNPMKIKTTMCVTLCSRIPKNLGFSPGAEAEEYIVRDFTWLMAGTVEASHQGKANMEQMTIIKATISKSRWYPQPFCES